MKKSVCNEKGYLLIEAAIVYPIVIILLVAFLYILLLFGQRAQMMNAAEQTIVYVKDMCSSNCDINISGGENGLPVLSAEPKNYNVYLNMFDTTYKQVNKLNNDGVIIRIFEHYMGTPLLINKNGQKPIVTIDVNNKFICTEIIVKTEYSMKSPINFSFIGGEKINEIKLSADVRGVIQNNTENIRTLNFVKYLYRKTGAQKAISDLLSWLNKGN